MNRYSLVFALLVASTFAVHPSQAGHDSASAGGGSLAGGDHANPATTQPKKRNNRTPQAADYQVRPAADDAVDAIREFMGKAASPADAPHQIQVLFVTVPHPIETHLAAAFDHNVDALQTGLQDAGYLFDSSVIPWDVKRDRDDFSDDELEKDAEKDADKTPGLLLFRKQNSTEKTTSPNVDPYVYPYVDPYANGIVIFLLSEKPTKGIELEQAKTAWEILAKLSIRKLEPAKPIDPAGSPPGTCKPAASAIAQPIRILGPSYSGSLDSLISVVRFLHAKEPGAPVCIRSGGVTGGDAAQRAVDRMAKEMPSAKIDFGSVLDNYKEWIDLSAKELKEMHIEGESIAVLSEDESLFGGLYKDMAKPDPSKKAAAEPSANSKPGLSSSDDTMWAIGFPRDISSLRASYAKQGVFEAPSPTQQWKRFLNLKNDAQGEGDSVRSFGGDDTTASQEAILFGISEFLKLHTIRAVILSATNEDDLLFLTQFLHANNPGVRMVVIGATRLFLRGSMAQFRGDLIVDNFPMFPLLHDWTGAEGDLRQHIFADDESEGTYFSALDLMAEPHCRDKTAPCTDKSDKVPDWYPEYSEPRIGGTGKSIQKPPMYIAAIGNDAAWPVAEGNPEGLSDLRDKGDHANYTFAMPFTLFARDSQVVNPREPKSLQLRVSSSWRILYFLLIVVVAAYCICILYADPIRRDQFAGFQPVNSRGYWMLKIAIPSAVASAAFCVMAWVVAIPAEASAGSAGAGFLERPGVAWWMSAFGILLAPAALVGTAVWKWGATREQPITPKVLEGIIAALAAAGLLVVTLPLRYLQHSNILGTALNIFREMHWESGVSLVPTAMFFLLAVALWAGQAGNGEAIIGGALPLPEFLSNVRISNDRGRKIRAIGRPIPEWECAKWLWCVWGAFALALSVAHLKYAPFDHLTTLEPFWVTFLVRVAGAGLMLLILLDTLQFLWLWVELRSLLLALAQTHFKRSFVSIREFDWRALWSFTGVSVQSMRALRFKMIDCLSDLKDMPGFLVLETPFNTLSELRKKYNKDPYTISQEQFEIDSATFHAELVKVGNELATWISTEGNEGRLAPTPTRAEAIRRATQSKSDAGPYAVEEEEVARLPAKNQEVEHFICLMYIGFIQTIVARLRTLLTSIASMYSLIALGIAIYPFVPVAVPLTLGVALLIFIALAFFFVFSQMDTDPVLSRIVNGDDRKLQGSFYVRFAEAMALPLLTAGSALLPGGVGRLLELAQTFLSQGH